MSWTKKNLGEVADAAKGFGVEGGFTARFAAAELEAEATGFALETLPPGGRSPFAHKHQNAEEVYVILSGSGRAKLDDTIVDVERLDALRVAPDVVRAFEAGDDGLEILVFAPRHHGEGELIHEDVFEG